MVAQFLAHGHEMPDLNLFGEPRKRLRLLVNWFKGMSSPFRQARDVCCGMSEAGCGTAVFFNLFEVSISQVIARAADRRMHSF